MRPFRLLLLLIFFVALPIFLTFLSLTSVHDTTTEPLDHGDRSAQSRLRTLFSFHTPSSLFPPSAIISLTYDNSTFFLARPAAFGPSLPTKGLSGQLWVGKGFGDELLSKDGQLQVTGWELGCSDVPGWGEEEKKVLEKSGRGKSQSKSLNGGVTGPADANKLDKDAAAGQEDAGSNLGDDDNSAEELDGTDDHLHRPLEDSNPAKAAKQGEPADHDAAPDKSKKPTHADIESLQEGAAIAGKIVMLSRGGCGFLEKVKWAQRRGGIGVIVGDNERGAALTIMYAKGDTSNVTIPALFTSYISAQILSSLTPPEHADDLVLENETPGKAGGKKANTKDAGPTFTATKSRLNQQQPTIVPAKTGKSTTGNDQGWAQNVLAAIGLGDEEGSHQSEDSRRPPSSGNIDWVLVEDWDDEDLKQKTAKTNEKTNTKIATPTVTSTKTTSSTRKPTGDDFVIGIQDWRDADLVAPKVESLKSEDKDKAAGAASDQKPSGVIQVSRPAQTDALKGGSITPGSGEYDSQKQDDAKLKQSGSSRDSGSKKQTSQQKSAGHSWFKFWRWGRSDEATNAATEKLQKASANKIAQAKGGTSKESGHEEHPGLWVTLTPTSVSTSPFFDTLLVLVISPLVTLTVVYALLLLRSRIRRRRWRAPKSVVERLPVRTYHTTSTSSSTTSSQVPSPNASSPASPLLRSITQDIHSRARPRSQTTDAIPTSASAGILRTQSLSPPQSSLPQEKIERKTTPKRKRYTGRQIECVVCLEEYIDGESRVMSLPCGHEFHAECITPWLVNRRRTCPICKGDVVRSLAKGESSSPDNGREEGEETSDDVQDRVVETRNDSPSAAIPVPTGRTESEDGLLEDEDVERGEEEVARRDHEEGLGQNHPRSRWRNILSSSMNALSGETVWRSATPVDRSR